MLNVDNAQELAQKIVRAIIGKMRASITMSDAYKFAMAQAGFPLREETFVLVFRKGGQTHTSLLFVLDDELHQERMLPIYVQDH